MLDLFPNDRDALEVTGEIADRCDVELDFDTYHLPVFRPDTGETPDEMFDRLCDEGARRLYGEITPKVRERLEYEKGIIRQLGFVSYFLITWDFIRFSIDNGIPVGPGRGSAAGSIVAYCLNITSWTRSSTTCCSSVSSTPNASRCRISTSTSAATSASS